MRIVIDTNIWISGLLWRGMPLALLSLAEKGGVELCMTPEMLDELAEVLNYERLQPRLEQLGLVPSELVAYVLSQASLFEATRGSGPIDLVVSCSRDGIPGHPDPVGVSAISGLDVGWG